MKLIYCLTPFVNKVLPKFISLYRKFFCLNLVPIDFSKAIDCIPYNLLIAKMSAYTSLMDTLVFTYFNLKAKKQNFKINNIESL